MRDQPDPTRVIRSYLAEARRHGLDNVSQQRWAVRRVLTLRPDLGQHTIEKLVRETMWPCPHRLSPPNAGTRATRRTLGGGCHDRAATER